MTPPRDTAPTQPVLPGVETGVRVRATAGGSPAEGATPEPCVLCILGVNGDLATGKLIPALNALAQAGRLPDPFAVIGCARGARDDELRERFAPSLRSAVHACAGDFSDPGFYRTLDAQLREVEQALGCPLGRIVYLATPPGLYPVIVGHLAQSGVLERPPAQEPARGRLVVEKPFGRDLESAQALNRCLAARLREDQIFRIDHYLAKDTVQNILVLRYANLVFEPLWGRHYVDHVQITAAETVDVRDRGRLYESVGVVRDIFQNHLLQLLALVAMEAPVTFGPEDIRQAKLDLLRSLRPLDGTAVRDRLVLGQYEGYRGARGVDPESRVATYVAQELRIDNWRWQGVPFYLRAGKALGAARTEIALVFRTVPHCLFDAAPVCGELEPNVLTLRIQPAEGVHLGFMCKEPGHRLGLAAVDMDMGYAEAFNRPLLGAYERVLLDAMRGDPTLFMRDDEIEQAWRFVAPLLGVADNCPHGPAHYRAGSDGPPEADALLARSGRRWLSLAETPAMGGGSSHPVARGRR